MRKGVTLQYIVFDLFHTLVDPEDFRPKDVRRAERVAELLQIDPDAFSTYWTDTLTLRITQPRPVISLIEEYLSRLGKTCSPELLSQVEYEFGRYQDLALLNPRPEVVLALKSLNDKGFKLGMLTNCDEREAREWKRSPISSFFNAACFSYAMGRPKPDREAYRLVLESLGASASQTAYVGDGGSRELEGARSAGFSLIVFMKGFVSRNGLRNATELEVFQRSADMSIDSLQELPDLLDKSDEDPKR